MHKTYRYSLKCCFEKQIKLAPNLNLFAGDDDLHYFNWNNRTTINVNYKIIKRTTRLHK